MRLCGTDYGGTVGQPPPGWHGPSVAPPQRLVERNGAVKRWISSPVSGVFCRKTSLSLSMNPGKLPSAGET